METVGEMVFEGRSKEEIIRAVFDMNKHILKKEGKLIQTLFFKKESDLWYIVFPDNDDQEAKDKFWEDALNSVSNGIESMMLVSDVTTTDMDTNRKKDRLMLHYLDSKGTVIVKVAEYTKRFLKGIVFEEEMDEDPSILFYYLGPIAEIYKGKK